MARASSPSILPLLLLVLSATASATYIPDVPIIGAPAVVEGPPNNAIVDVDRRPPGLGLGEPSGGAGYQPPTVPSLGDALASTIQELPVVPDVPIAVPTGLPGAIADAVEGIVPPQVGEVVDSVSEIAGSVGDVAADVVRPIQSIVPIVGNLTLPLLPTKTAAAATTAPATAGNATISGMPKSTKEATSTWQSVTLSASPTYGGTLPKMDKPCFGKDCDNPDSGMKYEQVVKAGGDSSAAAAMMVRGSGAVAAAVMGAVVAGMWMVV